MAKIDTLFLAMVLTDLRVYRSSMAYRMFGRVISWAGILVLNKGFASRKHAPTHPMFVGIPLRMLAVGISLIHTDLEHPPSSCSHEIPKHSCVFINDNMVTVVHGTALGIGFKSWNIWNIANIQGSKLYSFEQVHVRGMPDVLPASNK